ncbi:MAG: ISNCY family transposase, partial [Candidatus Aceula meridiana]|nr:ISNCY family transposase [Candidatus Aceula meridiana]
MTEGDIITMRQEELRRLHVIKKVLAKELKQVEAAEKLDLSYRQTKRITKRVKKEGNKGIIHKSRGQPSKRKMSSKTKDKVIELYQQKYYDFGPTFANEKLFEIDKIKIGVQTLRNWLIKEGLWQRQRKRKKYRQRRERKHCFGEMVQLDGSHHPWFEDRGSKCVLEGYIDDATSNKYGRFYEYECTMPAFDSLKRYIKHNGIPHSIYLDRHSTYKSTKKPTIEDQLNNRKFLSQFERAAKELGIIVIHANSPQAKGRIERSFKTDQDRLVKEM